ncbi:hypothetical protein [Sulfobacillus thermosulfidooxidans]|uniref:hypothetical protein n=1 Tax=Sulfobacillus thermosulfidooxidans TaxID=28034 RepID=UPI0006B549F4|nr:hypothetical protein [Sulfobacillus thermosulfidooxidans]
MRASPLHSTIPIRWSLVALRQVMGQEIAKVTGDDLWHQPLPGTRATWEQLHQACHHAPRAEVWEGPWLLCSAPDVWEQYLTHYDASPPDVQVAIREALWFWGGLDWSPYANLATWALESYLIDIWLPDFWRTLVRWPSRPVRDWLRLERRILYLRVAIDTAAQDRASARWGQGWIDCQGLILNSKSHDVSGE